MSKYEINLYDLFVTYMDFLRENPPLDFTAFYDKYKIFLKDEKNIVKDFFSNNIQLSTFDSFDVNKFLQFLQDWYISVKTILRQVKEIKDPYLADEDFLDNIIRSLGIHQVDQLYPGIKPDFSLDIVNLYKKKGTIDSIRRILSYYYLVPNEIFEFWLTKEQSGYWLVGKSRRCNFVKNTVFDFEQKISLDQVIYQDPHWYYTKSQLDELVKKNKLSLPSLTPYIKVILSRDVNYFVYQYLQVERTCRYIYNYVVNSGDINRYRWLYLEKYNGKLSLLEVVLGYSYLFNIRYNRHFLNDRNLRYLYTNITPPADFVAQYDENDIRTRKFEYDYLKKIWEEFTSRPQLKTEYSSEHGKIFEDKQERILPNKKVKRRLFIINEVYESESFNILGTILEPSIFYFNNTLFINGGQFENGTWNNKIISVNGEKLSSVQFVPILDIPIKIKGHGSFRHKHSYYLFGGINESGNVINKIYEYNRYTNSWSNRDLTINRHNFKFFRISEDLIVILFGYNSNNSLVCDKISVYNITKGKLVDISASFLKAKYITNYDDYIYPNNLFLFDYDYNQDNKIVLSLYDQNKILLIDLNAGLNKLNTSSRKRIYDEIILPEGIETLKNSKIFIDNSNKIYLIIENICYVYNDSKWSKYIFNNTNEFPEIIDQYKVKTNRLKYFYLFGQQNGSNCNSIQEVTFEWVEQPEYHNMDNYILLNKDVQIVSGSNKVITYENFRYYSNRRSLEEKLDTFTKLFTDKAPNYLYKDLFFNTQYDNNSVEKLGIEEDEQKLLYDVNDISTFLDNINPEYKEFLDRCLLLEEKDFNKILLDIVSLIDLYIRLYWKDRSDISSLLLSGTKEMVTLVNEFKPIHSRYLGFSTVLNFKEDWSNSIYIDEKSYMFPFQYSSDYITIREDIVLNPDLVQILNDYYIPPASYKYDYMAKELWRKEYHDLQLNVILAEIILRFYIEEIISIIELFNMKIVMDIYDYDSCLHKYNAEVKYDHSIKYCSPMVNIYDENIQRVIHYFPSSLHFYKYNHRWLYDSTIVYTQPPYYANIIDINEHVNISAYDVNTGDKVYEYNV